MGHVAYLNEDEIAALVDRISDACDGERAVMILVAFSDMLADIASSRRGAVTLAINPPVS